MKRPGRIDPVKIVVLGLIACCAALVAAEHGSQGDRTPRTGQGAATSGSRMPRPVHPRRPGPTAWQARACPPRAALREALRRHARTAIVLAPGAYRGRRPFLNPSGHRLYAARPGRAVLRAGLSMGGNSGPGGGLVRGLVVDVGDARRTVEGAAIAVWGTGRRTQILDTTVKGRGTCGPGSPSGAPTGCGSTGSWRGGSPTPGCSSTPTSPTRTRPREPFEVTDVDVARVARPRPGSSNGRAEACVWIGDTGTVRRVRVRTCGWSGLWTGTAARRARFEDIDIDGTPTGVYVEHFTRDSTFRRLRIGSDVRIGLLAEWAAPEWGGRPASTGNVIEDSRFETTLAGVYLDEGSTSTTVRRSAFAGQAWAGDRRLPGMRQRLLRQRLPRDRARRAAREPRPPHDLPGSTAMTIVTPPAPVALATVSTGEEFEALAHEWDGLVRAMPRPSPFMLHAWLAEWWPHYGDGAELAVHVARREARLVGALPLVVRRRAGLRVASFMGGRLSVLPDLLLAPGEAPSTAERARARSWPPAAAMSPTSTGCPRAAASRRRSAVASI